MCFGVVNCAFDEFQSTVQSELNRIVGGSAFNCTKEIVDWSAMYKAGGHLHDIWQVEIVLFSPHERLSVYVCNLADGWHSLYWNCMRKLAIEGFWFRSTDRTERFQVQEMEAWRDGTVVRHLRILDDEARW